MQTKFVLNHRKSKTAFKVDEQVKRTEAALMTDVEAKMSRTAVFEFN